ncbi:uncharacterized protein C2845_PM11G27120 [Panicum miliaceum]|uniref:Uncharacterized protein n=1 Tax=Panicum miliaceum TaxID=4540 RepID=A0A3L6RN79_PANMI|nr:uncharacterized protein C2845_PM11G27120 [Panicum miliaceum]
MAAAALRCAVRRLGGRELQLQQRTYAAGLEGIYGSRAVWPTSSRLSSSSTSSGAATNRSSTHTCKKSTAGRIELKNELLNEIQHKKEELFNMLAVMDKVPSSYFKDNIHLLMYLSEQIQKPNDPKWRFYRRAIRLNRYFQYGAILLLGYMAISK